MLGKKGFTLIELLVVIIIVGILAAVAVPMMRGNVMRARASEAIATLGAIRTQMRLELAEHSAYNHAVTDGLVIRAAANGVPGFSANDLNGRYFSDGDYSIVVTDTTFTATATGANAGGTSGENMSSVSITIDHNGLIGETGY